LEPDSWIALLVALLCLFLIAVNSAIETALTNISRLRLRQLLERGVPRAQAINDLLDNPRRFSLPICTKDQPATLPNYWNAGFGSSTSAIRSDAERGFDRSTLVRRTLRRGILEDDFRPNR